MKFSLSDLIDNILLFASVSILGFITVGYFSRKSSVILISGFVIGLSFTFFINMFKQKKQLPKAKRKQADLIMNHFIYSGKAYCHNFILNALKTKYSVTDCSHYILVNKTAVFLHLLPECMSLKFLADSYAKAKSDSNKMIFLCAYKTDNATIAMANALPDMQINIFDFEKVLSLLKFLNCVPTPTVKISSKPRTGLKIALAAALDKKRAKHYLFASFILLLSSLILPFGVYYTVIGCLLITLSVLCRIDIIRLVNNKKPQNKQNDSP